MKIKLVLGLMFILVGKVRMEFTHYVPPVMIFPTHQFQNYHDLSGMDFYWTEDSYVEGNVNIGSKEYVCIYDPEGNKVCRWTGRVQMRGEI